MNTYASLNSAVAQIMNDLDQRVSGHVEAYATLLSSDKASILAKLYTEKSSKIWMKLLQANSKDWIAIHHLAVSTHAEAFDLELAGMSPEAFPLWEQAINYWYRLHLLKEPLRSIQQLMQKMERYQADIQDTRFEQLQQNFAFEVLNIHRDFYFHYLENDEIENAERHYQIIENSHFKETADMLAQMYETKFGEKVRQIEQELMTITNKAHFEDLDGKLRNLKKEIKELSRKRSSLTIAIRDLIKLSTYTLRLGLKKWKDVHLHECNNAIHKIISEMEELELDLKSLKPKLNTYETVYQNQAIIDRYNEKVRQWQGLDEQRKQEQRKLSEKLENLKTGLLECDNYLSQLNTVQDKINLQTAVAALQTMVNKISFMRNVRGIENLPGYQVLEEHKERMSRRLADLNIVSGTVSLEDISSVETFGLWEMGDVTTEDNPYRNTCFLLLETAFPALDQSTEVDDLIKKLKIQKNKLSGKASANRHFVFGKIIREEALNRIGGQLDDPIFLAKNILLQHQAHYADLDDLKDMLAEIADLEIEQVPFDLGVGIFNLFDWSIPPNESDRQWELSRFENPPAPLPIIEWPDF